MAHITLTVHRDSLNTPWGIRVMGGADFTSPFTVQRIFTCSPLEMDLKPGDVILEIDGRDITSFSHKDAQDLLASAGGTMSLKIARPITSPTGMADKMGGYYTIPKAQNTLLRGPLPNANIRRTRDDLMMNKIQSSLDKKVTGPPDENYTYVPVRQRKQVYTRPPQTLYDPVNYATPATGFSSSSPQSNGQPQPRMTESFMHDSAQPAWLGSLRASSAPRQARHYQHSHPGQGVMGVDYGGGYPQTARTPHNTVPNSVQIEQQAPMPGEGPRVVHLQYNTPINMYSAGNINQALEAQTHGQPGHGTLKVFAKDEPIQKLGDVKQSAVYQMIHQQDAPRPQVEHQENGQPQQQPADTQAPYTGTDF